MRKYGRRDLSAGKGEVTYITIWCTEGGKENLGDDRADEGKKKGILGKVTQ